MSDDGFVHHIEFFDLESELYTAMAEETEGLGPPELDLDRVRAAGRRRRMLLAGSGAAVALIGVTVAAVAVAVGGSGSGAAPSTSPGVVPSPSLPERSNPTGCDGMPKAVVPYFTGSAKPTTPPRAPATPRTVVTTAVDGCRVVIQLPPYEIPGSVSSTGR